MRRTYAALGSALRSSGRWIAGDVEAGAAHKLAHPRDDGVHREASGYAAVRSRMCTPQALAEADDVGEADLGALDLTIAGLTAKVVADLPDVGDAGRRDRVALRLQAAGHVDRRRAVAPRCARFEEVDGAAFGGTA